MRVSLPKVGYADGRTQRIGLDYFLGERYRYWHDARTAGKAISGVYSSGCLYYAQYGERDWDRDHPAILQHPRGIFKSRVKLDKALPYDAIARTVASS